MAAIGDLNARRGGFAGIAGAFPRPTTDFPIRRADQTGLSISMNCAASAVSLVNQAASDCTPKRSVA
jgi:hypothetical protein